jgi:hypothetical protein
VEKTAIFSSGGDRIESFILCGTELYINVIARKGVIGQHDAGQDMIGGAIE